MTNKFEAPKTRLMALIIDGILNGKLPWELVLIGALIAVVLELAGVPSLPFAVGVYLPIQTSVPIFVGGMVRWFVDKIKRQERRGGNQPRRAAELRLHRRRLDRRRADRVLVVRARQVQHMARTSAATWLRVAAGATANWPTSLARVWAADGGAGDGRALASLFKSAPARNARLAAANEHTLTRNHHDQIKVHHHASDILDSRLGSLAALWLADLSRPRRVGSADEGMWLFNKPPRKQLKEKYGFEPTDAWLEHVQKSAVRFNSGGSGSFVSADGLVMTNHHVGADCLAKAQHGRTRT